MNNVVSKATHKTPTELLHGYHPTFHHSTLKTLMDNTNHWKSPEILQKLAENDIIT